MQFHGWYIGIVIKTLCFSLFLFYIALQVPVIFSVACFLRLNFWSFLGIVGVEIRQMRVPSVLESGSRPYVILDCDYDLSESEGTQVDVKWFFGSNPQPFYQWLPGRPPQTIGELFKNRIDLRYEVPGSGRFRKHRALKIWNPTTELSGTYRCKVSSFVDEDFMQKTMVIYCKFLLLITYLL